jgi:hypothetical protein
MNKKLINEINRMHVLVYGKEIMNEQEKADAVSDNTTEFFNTLKSASESGGLSQQKKGSINFQKAVESMQIGLTLLGYELPIYGIDGLFGSETSNAVKNFAKKELNDTKNDGTATPQILNKMIELLKSEQIKPDDLKKYIDNKIEISAEDEENFTMLDLSTSSDVQKYSDICDKFINNQKYNLLNITGNMMTQGAVNAYNKYGTYVPPELALAQLKIEGGFVGNQNARPIATKNPFNVGNVDDGSNVYHNSIQSGINVYYDLVARSYLGRGKSTTSLLSNFVNRSGNRYASDPNYEYKVQKFVKTANDLSKDIA